MTRQILAWKPGGEKKKSWCVCVCDCRWLKATTSRLHFRLYKFDSEKHIAPAKGLLTICHLSQWHVGPHISMTCGSSDKKLIVTSKCGKWLNISPAEHGSTTKSSKRFFIGTMWACSLRHHYPSLDPAYEISLPHYDPTGLAFIHIFLSRFLKNPLDLFFFFFFVQQV